MINLVRKNIAKMAKCFSFLQVLHFCSSFVVTDHANPVTAFRGSNFYQRYDFLRLR